MKHYSVMLKPASSACDLRCKYCFYADLAGKREIFSFGRMSEETVEKILCNIQRDLEPGDRVTFAFQGGEPTLIGLEWYRRFSDLVDQWQEKVTVDYALQTNGMTIDDEWCHFLARKKFLVGISMDAMPKCHNSCRVDRNGNGTYHRVEQTVQLLKKHRVEFNVLCTLTSEVARHPQQVWNWICRNDFRFVQFTPCLDELNDPGKSVYALHPKKFVSFYTRIFQLWLNDFQRGQYRSIKLFDDIVNLLAYGIPTACGMNGKCQCQMVVEADGSAYPCDFYCLDQYRLGSLAEQSVIRLRESETARNFLTRPRERSSLCRSCVYRNFCGGGCFRMQREVYCAPEDNFCGYQSFLDGTIQDFRRIAAQQRTMQRGR